MNTSDAIDQLATALAAAQAEMQNAAYNKMNPGFKSKYADLAAIREATLPALNKNGLALIQTTQFAEGALMLVTRLVHKGGQWVEGSYPIPLNDKPQIMGSALTYARRYAWAAVCGITAEEDDDAEAASKGKANGNGHAHTNGHISAEQLAVLKAAIKEVDADESAFLRYFKINDVTNLPAHDYERAITALSKRAHK